VIVATAVFNMALALGIWATAHLPGDANNPMPAQTEFGPTMQAAWRVVAASIIAQVIAELLDTEAYRAWVRRFADSAQWGRVLVSNAVSVPIDSVVFVLIAFGGLWPAGLIKSVIWTNIVWKGLFSVALIPLIYMVRERRDPIRTEPIGQH
jgi:uncharacterized integral membrane protein (TIGR00697 family)